MGPSLRGGAGGLSKQRITGIAVSISIWWSSRRRPPAHTTCACAAPPPAHSRSVRLSTAVVAPPSMVLGDEETAPQVQAVLSSADAPDALRATVGAALLQHDRAATQQLVESLRSADVATLRLLMGVVEEVLGPRDRRLAHGLSEQLRQVVELGIENEE